MNETMNYLKRDYILRSTFVNFVGVEVMSVARWGW